MRTGAGFLDYSGLDVDSYREQRLAALVDLLRHFWARKTASTRSGLAKHVLQHPSRTTATPSSSIVVPIMGKSKCPAGIAPGKFVGTGGKQEVAGNGAQLGAVGIALVVHCQRLVACAGFMPNPTWDTHRLRGRPTREIGARNHIASAPFAFEIGDVIVPSASFRIGDVK